MLIFYNGLPHLVVKDLWLIIIFPALFISDILYGGMNYFGIQTFVSPGAVIRGLLFSIAIGMVMKYHRYSNKYVLTWALTLTVLVLPSIASGLFVDGDLARDLYFLLRVLYGPFLIVLVDIIITKYNIEISDVFKNIEYAAYVLGLSLLVSQLLGIHRDTYGSYAYGSTGIFYAQNDLTLALGLALLVASYQLVYHFSFKRLVLVAICFSSCIQIGTRGSLIVVAGCGALIIALIIIGRKNERQTTTLSRQFVKIIVAIALVASLYGAVKYGLNMHNQSSYQSNKIEQILNGELPRLILITAGIEYINERPFFLNITGEGITSFMGGLASFRVHKWNEKLAEVDWLDLLGAYGIFFTFLLHVFFLYLIYVSSKHFLFGSRDPKYGLIGAGLMIYVAHSALAGHALVSPIPTTLIAGYVGSSLQLKRHNSLTHNEKSTIC